MTPRPARTSDAESAETALASVRPNPLRAGGAATVTFTTAAAGPVSLTVLDALGREVAHLVARPVRVR